GMSMNHRLAALAAGGAVLLGVGAGIGAAGTAGHGASVHRQRPAASHAAASAAQARAVVLAMLQGSHAPGLRAHRRVTRGPDGVTNVSYFNWSGYADTGSAGAFTKVSGSWTVSKLGACTGEHTTDSEWIGFDGFSNGTVEQDGSIGLCFEGKASYFDWYEMFPTQSSVMIEHAVSPGDKMSATVTRSGTKYTMVVTDATHAKDSFTATAACSASTCVNDSVEWINERDVFGSNGYSPLSDYGTWKLTGGAATKSGKSGSISSLGNVNNITMIDATGSYNLGAASALSGGSSFTTTWKDSW
ncbi:MAG TPA: G1 family glutamic endopeptidase, partial [Streptosporangiaceae bacterium]